jgi:hypothetical protein
MTGGLMTAWSRDSFLATNIVDDDARGQPALENLKPVAKRAYRRIESGLL